MSENTTEDALRAILDNLEAEQSIKNKNETISYINQPEKLAISSNNGEQAQVNYNGQYQNAFYNFTVNLPRPALGIKSIELLSANIPQCQVSIPDESLIFFYYKLKSALNNTGNQTVYLEAPSINNIHYVRLLPSYYKQELVQEYPTLAFNRTFNSYKELAAELVKACANDLIYEKTAGALNDYFIPDDISITYNEDINKFQLTGNNTDEPWTEPTYALNPASVVQENAIVSYQNGEYISKQNDNPVNPALVIYNYTSSIVFTRYNVALYSGTYYTCKVSTITNVVPTNTTYWDPSTYDPATAYPIGFNVLYNGYWYVAISVTFNQGNTPGGSSSLFWRFQPYTTGGPIYANGAIMTSPSWLSTKTYTKGEVVRYSGLFYYCILDNQNTNPSTEYSFWEQIANTEISASLATIGAAPWQSSITYNQGDVVSDLGITYIQVYNQTTTNLQPYLYPTLWNVFTSPYRPSIWRGSGFVYNPFEVVVWVVGSNYYFYTCIAENNNMPPTGDPNSALYWILSGWDSSINYSTKSPQGGAVNFPVLYDNEWYSSTSLTPNTNKQPDTNGTYWNNSDTITGNTGVMDWWEVFTGTTGYSYLSAGYEDPIVFQFAQEVQELSLVWDFDFNALDAGAVLTLYSIPPQPIAQYQTLNLRLGFTWDGVYTWDSNTILTGTITDVYQNGSIPCMLFNRLRPVPYYQLLLTPSGLVGDPLYGNPYISTTYTADAFCNLVYSSIINIYTNIIGPSTTDTERNVNLLDTVPLNCNNLGITFYNPVISNKLTKIPNDMYSIYFEFRREDGTEYYFSNNAIITITLGLTYK